MPGNILPPQNIQKILRNAPIEVELRAFVKPYCPKLLCPWMAREDGGKMIRGIAIGYRENSIPRGPLPPANVADMPPGYATATLATTTTLSLSPVTTVPDGPTGNWPLAFSWTQNNHGNLNVVWCPGIPNPVPCPQAEQ